MNAKIYSFHSCKWKLKWSYGHFKISACKKMHNKEMVQSQTCGMPQKASPARATSSTSAMAHGSRPDFVSPACPVAKSSYTGTNTSSPPVWIQSSGRDNVAWMSCYCPLQQVMFWALMWETREIWRRESDNFSREKIHNYSWGCLSLSALTEKTNCSELF